MFSRPIAKPSNRLVSELDSQPDWRREDKPIPGPRMLPRVRKKYSIECLKRLNLAEGDVRFLSRKGVRDLPQYSIFFYDDCREFEWVAFEGANYLVIGKGKYGEQYCIREKTREIYRIDLSPGGVRQYFNANIICLDLSFSSLVAYL